MRTMTSSISQTCPNCGTLNTLVILTTGLTPSWRIGCSRCGATVIEARAVEARARPPAPSSVPAAVPEEAVPAPEPSADIVQLPVPVSRAALPAQRGANAPATRRPRLPRRAFGLRVRSGASTGASFLAACGLVLALLVGERDAAKESAGAVELAETGTVADDRVAAGPMAGPMAGQAAGPDGGSGGAAVPAEEWAPPTEPPTELAAAHAAPSRSVEVAGTDAPVIRRYRLAAALAVGDRKEAYPDPREGIMRLQLAALADPEAAAEAEAGLELSRAERREVQRRLRLAEHDPKGVDGVFGPATRTAIVAWQEKAGLPATGYVTEGTLSELVAQTDEAYRAWRVAVAERRERERRMASVAPVPRPQQVSADGCARLGSGEIAYGQNLRCDVKGLSESLGAVRETLAQAFGGAGQSRLSKIGRGPDDA